MRGSSVMFLAWTLWTVCFAVDVRADERLPTVEDDFHKMAAGKHAGRSMKDLVDPALLQRVVLLERFSRSSKKAGADVDANEAMRILFAETGSAKDLGLLAEERSAAKFLLITKAGDIYFVDVLQRSFVGKEQLAFLVRGKGFGCRFDALTR